MDLIELLDYVPVASLDYQGWINVGMALKHEGYPCSVWDSWSRADHRYTAGACDKKWNTFQEGTSAIVTGGTIYDLAVKYGYQPKEVTVFDWNDTIEYDGDKLIKDVAWLDSSVIEAPSEWSPVDELRRYLQALFKPEDIIGYCVDAMNDDGKWRPASKGAYGRKVADILQNIKNVSTKKLSPEEKLRNVIGDYDVQAGAWIRFNPLDGQGVGNSNVTEYRYALVESDTLALEKQKALMEELQLPIAVMVSSGGKSIHAIVKIGAATEKEYRERVDYLYNVCAKNGLVIDTQNKNPSRLSRMPGVRRAKSTQFIIAENIGQPDFTTWQNYIEDSIDTLPEIISFSDVADNLPPLAPELIEGVLRQGHKMLIAGASKAGKSFALIELGIAVANGKEWLGHKCKQGKVLYLNMEVDGASFLHRVADVYKALGEVDTGNLKIWNLRGENANINVLAPRLIRRARNSNYSVIIFDPLYKINEGDENSASEMAKFFNSLDAICKQLGCSVVCCHHHSKGAQGGKFSMDRASGSGVFARDPDAILDMIQINPRDVELSLPEGQTAWRISYTLREFMTPEPTDVIFEYPLHKITHDLEGAEPMTGADSDTKRKRGRATQSNRKAERIDRLLALIENWPEVRRDDQHMYLKIDDAVEYFESDKGYSKQNIKKWASEEDAEFEIRGGYLYLK